MSCSADDVKHLFVILSYLSALGMRLIVLALTALLLMPRSVAPVAVSLPSQMRWKNRCSVFGSCLTVGIGIVLLLQTRRVALCGLCSICGSSWCCHPHVLRSGWIDTLFVAPAMVQLDVCWRLFCRSFVVIGLLVF